MTLAEYDDKISDLQKVQANATGLKKAKLTSVIDDLRTARVETLTDTLNAGDFGFSSDDIAALKEISNTFESALGEVEDANELMDKAISLGKKLVALVV